MKVIQNNLIKLPKYIKMGYQRYINELKKQNSMYLSTGIQQINSNIQYGEKIGLKFLEIAVIKTICIDQITEQQQLQLILDDLTYKIEKKYLINHKQFKRLLFKLFIYGDYDILNGILFELEFLIQSIKYQIKQLRLTQILSTPKQNSLLKKKNDSVSVINNSDISFNMTKSTEYQHNNVTNQQSINSTKIQNTSINKILDMISFRPKLNISHQVEKYLDFQIKNMNMELNEFCNQMKLPKAKIQTKTQGKGIKVYCSVELLGAFNKFQSKKYEKQIFQNSNKNGKTLCIRQLLKDIYCDNIKLWHDFKQIKKNRKLIT